MKAKRRVGWVFLGFLGACSSNFACTSGNSTPAAGGKGGSVGVGGLGGEAEMVGLGGGGGGAGIDGTGGQGGGQAPVTPVRVTASPELLMMDENTSTPTMIKVSLSMPWSEDITLSVSSNANIATVMPESLVFRAGEVGPKMVLVSAPPDDDTVDNTTDVVIESKDTGSARVTVNVHDIDVQGIRTSATKLSLTEGKTESLGVRLYKKPASTVVVTLTASDPTKLIFDQNKLMFDASNYSLFQPVAITPPKDDDALNEHVTIKLSATGNLQDVPVSVDVSDIDAVNFDVSPSMLSLLENGMPGSINVKLTREPPNDVTVSVKSSKEGAATVSPATLTFTAANYAMPQAVSVTPVADNDTKDEDVTITLSASGITPLPADRTVGVMVKDTDKQALVVSAPTIVAYEGYSTTFKVRMALQPDANTTVTVFSQDASKVTIQSPTLYFNPSNYADPQTVTITAVQDDDLSNDDVKISLIGNNIDPVTVVATVMDDDHQAIILDPSATLVTQESRPNGPASKATVGVRLAFRPTNALTVDLKSSDPTRLVPGALTSLILLPNNFNTAQFVTFTAAHDDDTVDNSPTITASAPDVPDQTLKVTIVDTDVQNFDIATTSIALMESIRTPPPSTATSQNLQVNLTAQPAADMVVSFTSTLTGKLAFTPVASCVIHSASWMDGCFVTVAVVPDDDGRSENGTISINGAADGKALTPRVVTVSIKDNDLQKVLVSMNTVPKIDEGMSGTFSVALDLNPIDPVTISISSSDPLHFQVPSSVTLTKDNYKSGAPVDVAAVDDQDMDDYTGLITIQGVVPNDKQIVTVSELNKDTQHVVLSPFPVLSMLEAGSAQIGVRLMFKPSGTSTETVTLSTEDKDRLLLNGMDSISNQTVPVVFSSNFSTNQFVTLYALKDVTMGEQTVNVHAASSPSGATADETVKIKDIDMLNFVANPTSLSDLVEGTSKMVDLRLTVKPPSAIHVTVTSDSPSVLASFAAGASCDLSDPVGMGMGCPLTITAAEDSNASRETAHITVAGPAGTIDPVVLTVTTLDNDTQNLTVTPLTSIVVSEPKTGTTSNLVTVKLDAMPDVDTTVTITPIPAGAGLVVSPSSITFRGQATQSPPGSVNYNEAQNVTIIASHDDDLKTDSYSVHFAAVNLGVSDRFLDVTVVDGDTQDIVLTDCHGNTYAGNLDSTEFRGAITEGAPSTDAARTLKFCVSLAFQPLSNTVVNFDVGTGTSTISAFSSHVLPFSFTTANFNIPQEVIFSAASDGDTASDMSRYINLSSSGFAATRSVRFSTVDSDRLSLIFSGMCSSDSKAYAAPGGAAGVVGMQFSNDPISTASVFCSVPETPAGITIISPTRVYMGGMGSGSGYYNMDQFVRFTIDSGVTVGTAFVVTCTSSGQTPMTQLMGSFMVNAGVCPPP